MRQFILPIYNCSLLIVFRLAALRLFLTWRVRHPNRHAMWLWAMSVTCELWFALSWILDQLYKLCLVNRVTDLSVLKERFESPNLRNPKGRSDLPGIEVFVSIADPEKESPLVTSNTILSILAVDYPVEKLACYLSDDGGSLLTFEALAETASFARTWVPFCRKHKIEPRNPEAYFGRKRDLLKNKARLDFVRERRRVKREYDEFKVRINSLPESIRRRSDAYNANEELRAKKKQMEIGVGNSVADSVKVAKATWMFDGSLWPGTWTSGEVDHSRGDHAGIIQAMLAPPNAEPVFGSEADGENLIDTTEFDIRLSMLVYVSREKRSGYDQNKKAGAMNALVRTSAIMSNGPFILNLDCDHYVYNSLALREGMCFMLDRGCIFRKIALYRFSPPRTTEHHGWFGRKKIKLLSRKPKSLRRKKKEEDDDEISLRINDDGNDDGDVESLLLPRRTKLSGEKESGWIYGLVTEDVVTGYRMRNRGWRSIYCVTKRDAFRGTTPINLTDRLHQVLRWATGSVEISFSRNNALFASHRMKFLQRVAYFNAGMYPFTSFFLIVYCVMPALSLFSGQFIVASLNVTFLIYLLAITLTLCMLALLEIKWSGITLHD
ncbi:unnamed protein product [Linum tenue]|uniref:Uncharacterized protein n=1 Tax=Linum tenue TaxID=586396 RepID=A0AAV0NPA5_9ROSI|nr:unnamed protein product [Linum tenue]